MHRKSLTYTSSTRVHRVWGILWLSAIALHLFYGSAPAQPFDRKVLGIFNSEEGKTEIHNPLRFQVEMVLNHLGLKLEYHDIASGLPDGSVTEGCRGIVVWLDENRMSGARAYWRWLAGQMEAGRRLVLLTGVVPRTDRTTGRPVPLFSINRTLAGLGVVAGDDRTDLAMDIELVEKDPAMVEFERGLETEMTSFGELRSIGPDNRVCLKLRMRSSGAFSDAVVIAPNGGLVMPGYLRYVDPDTEKKQWRIDPFSFFARTLGVEDSPRPDPTTLNGVRLAYSHIDGDGIANASYTESPSVCGEIVLRDILKAYPALPFTVSVIIHEVAEQTTPSRRSIEAAKAIFRLPNVEAASHTYSHPLIWNTSLVPSTSLAQYEEVMAQTMLAGRALIAWRIPGYDFSPERETAWSARYVEEHFLPPEKLCRVLLWSGNCLPDEETVAASDDAGLLNMNGGDARFDGEYPSYVYVTPLYRKVGERYQIHSSNSNENTYTGLWTGPFGGFQNVIQTYVNTETPRRVSPVNVYYHFYSGERPAGVHALKTVYEWLVAQQTFPVFASDYVKIVHGFISCKVEKTGEGVWRISSNGACRTIRFDEATLVPDLDRCEGVIGFDQQRGALYVHLDGAQEHTIALAGLTPTRPFLRRATGLVNGIRMEGAERLSFETAALEAASFVWDGFPAGARYEATIEGNSRVQRLSLSTDVHGSLAFSATLEGPARITLERRPGQDD